MNTFVYSAAARLNDGTERLLDLEAQGWADKDMLSKTTRFSLIPKEGALTAHGTAYPLVVVNIPEGGKPVYRSRVMRREAMNGNGEYLIDYRVYCVGWKKGRTVTWTWVLPTGDIETGTGDESYLNDLLFSALVAALNKPE